MLHLWTPQIIYHVYAWIVTDTPCWEGEHPKLLIDKHKRKLRLDTESGLRQWARVLLANVMGTTLHCNPAEAVEPQCWLTRLRTEADSRAFMWNYWLVSHEFRLELRRDARAEFKLQRPSYHHGDDSSSSGFSSWSLHESDSDEAHAVSYTHLTLPTILLV